MSVNYNPSVVTSGLVLNLDAANIKSYPASGTSWFDLSGNGNTGTLVSGPTFNSTNGGSIIFNSGNSVQINHSTSIDVGGAGLGLTVCYWLYCLSTGGYDAHVGKSSGTGWIANLNWDMGVGGLPQLRWWLNNTVSVTYNTTKTYLNNWRFIAMSVDRTTSYGNIYEDGVLVSSGNIGTPTLTNSGNLQIANDPYGSWANARFSCIQVYNRALSSQEILQNFNAMRGRYGL